MSIRFLPELTLEPSFAKTFLQSPLYQSYQDSRSREPNASLQNSSRKLTLQDLKSQKGKLEQQIKEMRNSRGFHNEERNFERILHKVGSIKAIQNNQSREAK
jgi:hypothetical protein